MLKNTAEMDVTKALNEITHFDQPTSCIMCVSETDYTSSSSLYGVNAHEQVKCYTQYWQQDDHHLWCLHMAV